MSVGKAVLSVVAIIFLYAVVGTMEYNIENAGNKELSEKQIHIKGEDNEVQN